MNEFAIMATMLNPNPVRRKPDTTLD